MQLVKCDVCQRMNRKLTNGSPELHPIPVKSPWYMVGIDFIGPLSPEATDGSRFISTLSDYILHHPVVHVYDSMYPLASTVVKAQIATILHTVHPSLSLQFMDVQVQAGGYDCSLFAVAFLVSLALGKSPGQCHFHQDKMCQHLWRCFQNRELSMFPYSKLRRATESSVKAVEEVHVYCVCRMPELPNTNWIECFGCKNWYHRDTCLCHRLQLSRNLRDSPGFLALVPGPGRPYSLSRK